MKVKNTDLKLFNQHVTSKKSMFNFLYQIFQVTYFVYRMPVVDESVPRTLFTLSDLFQFISCPVLEVCFLLEDVPSSVQGSASTATVSPPLSAIGLSFLPAPTSTAQSGCGLFLLPSITWSDSRAGVALCLSQQQLLVASTAQGTLLTLSSVQAADLCPLAFPVPWGQRANDLLFVRHQK